MAPAETAALIAMFSPRFWVTPAWVVARMEEPFLAESLRIAQQLIGLRLDVESKALSACLDHGVTGHLIEVAAGVGFYDKLRAHGVTPTLATGHSVGIYTALAATGCLSLAAMLDLLADDIERFQATGGILAMVINVHVAEVEEECARIGEVWVSAYNGERLCTVSGTRWGVAHIETWVRGREGKLRRCDGFGPHHSALIRPLRPIMLRETTAAVLRAPEIPIAFPLLPLRIESTREGVIDAAIEQLMTPVHWPALVTTLLAPPHALAVEIGTGNVLEKLFQSTPRLRSKLRTLAECLAAQRSSTSRRSRRWPVNKMTKGGIFMLFAVETEMNPVGISGDEFMRRLPDGVVYLNKLQQKGTLIHAWIRVGGGGGLSIYSVDSHEALLGALYQNPLAAHLKFKVTPLAPAADFAGNFATDAPYFADHQAPVAPA